MIEYLGFLQLGLAVLFLHIVGERRRDLRIQCRCSLLVVLAIMATDRYQFAAPVKLEPMHTDADSILNSPQVMELATQIIESKYNADSRRIASFSR